MLTPRTVAPGRDGAPDLLLGVRLHERLHAQLAGDAQQVLEGGVVEGGDDEQDQIRPVGPGLVDLVLVDREVLAQHRDAHGAAHGVQIGQRAAEAALLGEHGDHGRTAALVGGGQGGGVVDRRQRALRRRGALDLRDDLQGVAVQTAQRGPGIQGRGRGAGRAPDLLERDGGSAHLEVLSDPLDEGVQHGAGLPHAAVGVLCHAGRVLSICVRCSMLMRRGADRVRSAQRRAGRRACSPAGGLSA